MRRTRIELAAVAAISNLAEAAARAARGKRGVLRGGSWINEAQNLRSAYGNHDDPGNRLENAGFRLALARRGGGCRPMDQTAIRSCRPAIAGGAGEKQRAGGVLVGVADAPRRLAVRPSSVSFLASLASLAPWREPLADSR